jgi:hypothetical protein
MQQQAAMWGSDATEWKPERWLPENRHNFPDEKVLPEGPKNLITFSSGPRMCIGWRVGTFFIFVLYPEADSQPSGVFEHKVQGPFFPGLS